jgi:excisionase family DNA binding protein
MEMKDYVSVPEAAKLLGVSPSRVRQLIGEQRIIATKVGRDNFLLKKDVDAFDKKDVGRPRKNLR